MVVAVAAARTPIPSPAASSSTQTLLATAARPPRPSPQLRPLTLPQPPQTTPFNILTLEAANTTRNYVRLINSSGTSDGNGISFSPLTGAGDWEIGNDTNMNGTDNFYLFSATAATQVQVWTPTLITANRTLQVNAGLTLATTATNPGGASTLWWTTPSTRPNFGTNGPLALLSDVTGGSGVTRLTQTVNLPAPLTDPWTFPPTGEVFVLTKVTVTDGAGTSAIVYGQYNNAGLASASAGNTAPIQYPAGTVPAAFVPTSNRFVTMSGFVQGLQTTLNVAFFPDGTMTIQPISDYSAAPVSVSWGTGNAGITPNAIFSYPV